MQQDEGGTDEQEQEASSEGGQERWEASSEAAQAQLDAVLHRDPADQCACTLLEPEDVKLVLDDVKRLSTQEVMSGHTFLFPGLAMLKMNDQKRVVARACEGRAWNCVNVYGKRGKWR